MKAIKYVPKPVISIAYLLLVVFAVILFFGRKKTFFRIDQLTSMFPDFYQHISNFSISYLLLSGVGYMWLLVGIPFKYIAALAILLLVANFVYEQWIPILNTPDIIDAVYGCCGTMLAFLFLLLTKRYGLLPKP